MAPLGKDGILHTRFKDLAEIPDDQLESVFTVDDNSALKMSGEGYPIIVPV